MIGVGARVRVRDAWPELDGPAHIRTPHYLRGRTGTVLHHLGDFPNPEDIAFNRPAPLLPLYHVGFGFEDVWGRPGPDTLLVEIYGPWLEVTR
jgi:hypothetical protein